MTSLSRLGTFGVPLIVLALTQGAMAQSSSEIVSAANPAQILAVASSVGSASLTTDSTTGDPRIVGQIGTKPYSLYFYGCKNGKYCTDVQFNAAWAHAQTTLTALNQWHRTSMYGHAFLVNKAGDLVLQMPLNLDYGVTPKNLMAAFNDWILTVQDFELKVAKTTK
jgi:hypothetical protein